MIHDYGSLSATRLAQLVRGDVTLMVPCAPLEVHGPHLPLATDLIQSEHYARTLAERLSARFPEKIFLLHPALPIGVDPLPLPGSMGHDVEIVQRVLVRIGESARRAGISRMVITNFHGAPRHVLAHELACDELAKSGFSAIAPMGLMLGRIVETSLMQQVPVLADYLDAEIVDCETHAGALETAIIMAMGYEPDALYRDLPTLDYRTSGGRLADVLSTLRTRGEGHFSGLAAALPRVLEQLEGFFRVTDHFNRFSYGGAPKLATREMGEDAIARFTELQLDILLRFFVSDDPRAEEFESFFWKNRHVILSGMIERLFDGGWDNPSRSASTTS